MDQFQLLLNSPANLAILVANIVLSSMAFGNVRLMDRLLFDVGRMRRNKEWYRGVTSAFIHGDPFHLFMNMLALFFFGPIIEYSFGPLSFLGIYFGSLLGGSLWTWMEHFKDSNYKALGASGAISGLTSAIALFAPFSTIYAFFAIPMPTYSIFQQKHRPRYTDLKPLPVKVSPFVTPWAGPSGPRCGMYQCFC